MIIAGYSGIGKTTFAKQVDESIDLVIMPYKWELANEIFDESDSEKIKVSHNYEINENYPEKYLLEIISAELKYKYVLIPADTYILYRLMWEYNMPYVLCYPNIRLKEEYRQRFINRGNTEEFLNIFIDQWEERIDCLKRDDYGRHIELEENQFLTDVIEKIDVIGNDKCFACRHNHYKRIEESLKKLGMRIFYFLIKYINYRSKNACQKFMH